MSENEPSIPEDPSLLGRLHSELMNIASGARGLDTGMTNKSFITPETDEEKAWKALPEKDR